MHFYFKWTRVRCCHMWELLAVCGSRPDAPHQRTHHHRGVTFPLQNVKHDARLFRTNSI